MGVGAATPLTRPLDTPLERLIRLGKHASVRENQKKSEKRQKNARTARCLTEETYFIPAHTNDLNCKGSIKKKEITIRMFRLTGEKHIT